MRTCVGVDSGGTFTDAVAIRADGSIGVAKVPSTPRDPAAATVAAYGAAIGDGDTDQLRHGTTVPTNALLEKRGARTALVATRGFSDVIEIGRQRRPDLYDLAANRPAPLTPRELRFEVTERMNHAGEVVEALDMGDLVDEIDAAGVESVAISLLHSYANSRHEHAVARALEASGRFVVVSSDVANEFREFERTSTAVLHAYLGPGTSRYFHRLAEIAQTPDAVLVMRSSGGLGAASDLSGRPADALMSGPAAGALAAAAVARDAGFPDAVGFDMGGTSTDVCLIRNGQPELRALTEIEGYPCLSPALAIHTVGAGGGSIARLDAGGALRVGPRSAGAVPGPVAYGRGGVEPTVTDANVCLDRVVELVGGTLRICGDEARRAIESLGPSAAQGVVAVVEANMERAIREVTTQRGVDPGGLAIVAFGGAGALHAARLCVNIGARAVVVPPLAGLLSAVGLLAAPIRADRSHTVLIDLVDYDKSLFVELTDGVVGELDWAGRPVIEWSADCRYRGQSHEIAVTVGRTDDPDTIRARFQAEHERLNGYRRDGAVVQIATVRASATVASGVEVGDVLARSVQDQADQDQADQDQADQDQASAPVSGSVRTVVRSSLDIGSERAGPLLITETEATTYVPDDFNVAVDKRRNLVLEPR